MRNLISSINYFYKKAQTTNRINLGLSFALLPLGIAKIFAKGIYLRMYSTLKGYSRISSIERIILDEISQTPTTRKNIKVKLKNIYKKIKDDINIFDPTFLNKLPDENTFVGDNTAALDYELQNSKPENRTAVA